MTLSKKLTIYILVLALATGYLILDTKYSHSAAEDWQKGGSVSPRWDSDFESESFRKSLSNLSVTGASYATLIIPWYQSNPWSTDLGKGWNTPTDRSLISAINYAHSLGMKVNLKPHIENYDGQWRAYIKPDDKYGWFNKYSDMILGYARIAEQYDVEQITIGSELISMSADDEDGGNTEKWIALIGNIRNIYSGKLTYSANWGGFAWGDEKHRIKFWSNLDYIGISAYFNLSSHDDSVESLRNAWMKWEWDVKSLSQYYSKPILFTEIGYRSRDGARNEPWDHSSGGAYDPTEQSNLYEALFSFWNDQPSMIGVHLWEWSSDPNVGGQGNIDYTPQNKPAQTTIINWFGGNGNTVTKPTFTDTVSPTPSPTPSPSPTPEITPTPQPSPEATAGEATPTPSDNIEIWWPTNNARVSGTQPFKAMLKNWDISQYKMFWQVDGDRLNTMSDSFEDYPHKQAWVDLTNWNWRGMGPYLVNFITKDFHENIIRQLQINLYVN